MTHAWNWGTSGFCSCRSAIHLAYSHMGNSGSPRAAWVESEPLSDTDHVLLAEASAASVSRSPPQSRSDLFVSRCSSGSFTPLDRSLGQDCDSNNLCVPSLTVDASGDLHVAWEESDPYDGDKPNTDPLNETADPDLVYSASDGWPHIFVRRKDLSP